MSLGLIIDTSMVGVSLAICDFGANGKFKWKCIHPQKYGSAAKLSHLYQQGLSETGIKSSQISRILVSNGPGSFTGIKIGLSWAYGFSATNPQVEWMAISSLQAAAYYLGTKQKQMKPLAVFLPSTKTHGFMAYQSTPGHDIGTHLVQINQDNGPYGSLLSISQSSHILWAGPWDQMQAYLGKQVTEEETLSPMQFLEAGLCGMFKLAKSKEQHAWEKQYPKPNYLRKSTAEERLEEKKGV